MIEDSRGVDVGQIRRQLRMTVPERVRSMVEAANAMLAVQEHAQASLRRARRQHRRARSTRRTPDSLGVDSSVGAACRQP